MEEDLKVERQKEVLNKMLNEVSKQKESYYLSTIEVAEIIHNKISELNINDKELVESLSPRDIQILLSQH